MDHEAIFIGGFRSGTTLLINLLGMHPEVAPWFETKAFCEALRWMRVLSEPGQAAFETAYCAPPEPAGFDRAAVEGRMWSQMRSTLARIAGQEASGKAGHERYPIGNDCAGYSVEQAAAALADWSATVQDCQDYAAAGAATGRLITTLGALHCRALGRPRWINKTPEISRFAAELRDCLGGCRVIYLVRDGLDVVASARNLGWGEVESLAFNWKRLLGLTREAMREHSADYLELRYEDLLARPAAVLDEIADFCSLDRLGGNITERFLEGFGPAAFDLGRIGNGRGLSMQERALFDGVAGTLRRELGYR